jgi:NADPH:quinone reductase
MKALVITRLGGPEVLAISNEPPPVARNQEVLVNVHCGGLNFADVMTLTGGYPGTPPPPLVAGREFSGTEASSSRRVMGYTQYAAFAEQIAARQALLWPVPDRFSDEQAAAFPVNFFTAYFAYWQAGMVPSSPLGQSSSSVRWSDATPRVLIHAVAGGVGTAAVQIGQLLGVEMYGTSSSDDKLQRVKPLGLQHPINYKKRDYEEAIKDLTKGEGVDAVFEMLGGEHTAKSLRCLRDFGRVIQYGTATGKPPQLDLRAMYAKSASVQGLWLTYLSGKADLMSAAWKQLSAWANAGKLNPVVGHSFPFDHAPEAYELLAEGKNFGKVVLKIS